MAVDALRKRGGSWAAAVGAGSVALAGFALGAAFAAPRAPEPFKQEAPANRGLDANLYIQTSAEYRACCLQAFNLASLRLQEKAAGRPEGRPSAVVMDLDETVFDNGGFQAMQLRSNLAFDDRLWAIWERDHADEVGLVPGALAFIQECRKLEVAVVYISNRNEKYRDQAKAALQRLGIPLEKEDRLKLASDATGSNKTSRRAEAEKQYHVLFHVGDNLRDFDERFRCAKFVCGTPAELEAAIQGRKEQVDKDLAIWGKTWIILPNPAYGEWTKPLGRGPADLDRLAPTIVDQP